MIAIHAVIPLDPDERERGTEIAADLAEESRQEPGNIDYQVGVDIEDPNVLRFVERYEDEAAFAAHSDSEHFQEFEAALPDILGGEPEILHLEVESATRLDT